MGEGWPPAPTFSSPPFAPPFFPQSHGNFMVSVDRVVRGASVMIEAQEAATEGTYIAVPEGLVPEATQGVD